jgi:hypothetical protein
VFNAYRATEINFRAPTRATWDEIVSTGDTGLLPRDVVVSAGEYFAFDTARNHLDILNVSALCTQFALFYQIQTKQMRDQLLCLE